MLMLCFTYHEIMPEFLDLLFGFGIQDYAQDFHYSAFRQRNRTCGTARGLKIQALGWSGRDIQLCYSLKSVEPSKSQEAWPWSIRQSAVCHSFDVVTGRTTWFVVKADEKLKDRVKAATGSRGVEEAKSFATVEKSFASTLSAHRIFSELSAEDWRWYINFLESKFQSSTRHILSSRIEKSSHLTNMANPHSPAPHSPSQFKGKVPALEKRFTELSRSETFRLPRPKTPAPDVQEHPEPEEQGTTDGPPDFSFTDLQKIQHIEEKATEALLVLRSNATILTELRGYYKSLINSDKCPDTLEKDCRAHVFKFQSDILGVEKDLRMHRLRVESLLSLIAERKSLVSSNLIPSTRDVAEPF